MQYGRASVAERRFLPPAVAVSVVAFALRPPADAEPGPTAAQGSAADDPASAAASAAANAPTIWLPLVRRTRAPFCGDWALPGGPTEWDETLSYTATRTLRAAARRDPGYLEQLYSFGGTDRSADAQRLVTIAYWAMYGAHELAASPLGAASPAAGEPAQEQQPPDPAPAPRRRWDDPLPPAQPLRPTSHIETERDLAQGADDNVAWFSIDALPPLAFDHAEIVAHAVARLRAKTEYAAVAHRFLGTEFTLGELRAVTEAVLGQSVDPANFRRQTLARGLLVDTGKLEQGGAHRPARLYRLAAGVA